MEGQDKKWANMAENRPAKFEADEDGKVVRQRRRLPVLFLAFVSPIVTGFLVYLVARAL